VTSHATSADSVDPSDTSHSEVDGKFRYTLKKSEKLCSKRSFDLLFRSKKSIYSGCIQFIFSLELPEPDGSARLQVAFTAPKSAFKRAVDRNLVKRRMREAYRLHKHEFLSALEQQNKFAACVIKYNAREIRTFKIIEHDMVLGLDRLKKRL
jgi:ribonuclease P protein component